MEKKEIDLMDYLKIVWKWRKFIIITVLSVTLVSIVISLLLPKWYMATAVILPPSSLSSPLGASSILGNLGMGNILGEDELTNRYLAILKSRTLMEEVAKKFNLQEKYECENMEETIAKYRECQNIKVEDENQISVSFLDRDQEIVAEITNYIVIYLDSLNIILATSKARSNREFIETRIENVLDSLSIIEHKVVKFMESEGILSFNDQVRVGVEKAANMKAEIIAREIELEVTKKTFGKDNPRINRIKYELIGLRKKYREFSTEYSLDKLIPSFSNVPKIEVKLAGMQRNVEYYSKLLEFLGPQYEQAKIEEAKDIPTLQVLDFAVRPELKTKPRRKLIVIISGILSLMLDFFIISTKEYINRNRIATGMLESKKY